MKQVLIALVLLTATNIAVAQGGSSADGEVVQLFWDNLMPADFDPDEVVGRYDDQLRDLADDDPEADRIMAEIEAIFRNAPVVESLDGKKVKLPGYVLPLEGDGKVVSEFLLVPYFGACVHVPPPPSNQVVYVDAQKAGAKVRRMFDTVWVTGTLRVEHVSSEAAESGYRIDAIKVEPYTE